MTSRIPLSFARLAAVAVALSTSSPAIAKLPLVRPSTDGKTFVVSGSNERFIVWGVNYDHNGKSQLIEDYWQDDWPQVEGDFDEIKALGVNVIRIHLQLGKFMETADRASEDQLRQLSQLLKLAEEKEMYLNLTGLGCYRKAEVPEWYDTLEEGERWEVQARFWEAVAKTCQASSAVFCYDLMNEPILTGGKNPDEWLAGELGGFHYVQRITRDLAGRTQKEVAKAWVERLVGAIREHDADHMITVGVIPWAHVFPKAKPLFHSAEAGAKLDFVSVHFYPKSGEVDKALAALSAYEVGKPLVIEEMFPLAVSLEEMETFIERSAEIVDGWFGFYWGVTAAEYAGKEASIANSLMAKWLTEFEALGRRMRDQKTE